MFKSIKSYHKKLVGVFVVTLLVAVLWRIVGSRTYYPDMGINLVVVGEENVAIIGISKTEESLVWVKLPSNLRVGGYPVASVWGLGEIEGGSEELVKKSLGEGMGLWLQTALKVKGEVSVDGLLDRLLSFRGIRGLSWLDRYTLYKDVSSLASKGIVLETGLPNQVVDKMQDVDGYGWLELNEAVFVWSRDLWPKEEVVNLGVRIEVINASGVPGAARVRARQLESVGFRVVRVEADDVEINKPCLVRFKSDTEDENGLLRRIVKNYLNCDIEVVDELDDFSGDAVFVVGP